MQTRRQLSRGCLLESCSFGSDCPQNNSHHDVTNIMLHSFSCQGICNPKVSQNKLRERPWGETHQTSFTTSISILTLETADVLPCPAGLRNQQAVCCDTQPWRLQPCSSQACPWQEARSPYVGLHPSAPVPAIQQSPACECVCVVGSVLNSMRVTTIRSKPDIKLESFCCEVARLQMNIKSVRREDMGHKYILLYCKVASSSLLIHNVHRINVVQIATRSLNRAVFSFS